MTPKKATVRLTVALLALLACAGAQAATWNADAGGDWHDGAKWTGGVPNASGAVASFSSDITSDISVNLDAAATVGTLTFADAADAGSGYNSVTLTGANTLTFVGGANINANRGAANEIAVAINTGSQKLLVKVPVAGDRVILSGAITGSGGLEKSNDAGAIELLGDNSGWSGLKLLRVGRYGVGSDTCFGSGTVQINAGTIYSVGVDHTVTNYVQKDSGAVAISFDGSNGNSLQFTAPFALASANATGPGRLVFSGNLSSVGTLQGVGLSGRIDLFGSNAAVGIVRSQGASDYLTLGIGHDNALGPGLSIDIVRNVTLVALGQSRTVTQNLPLNTAVLTIDGPLDLTLAGNLTANGGTQKLVKKGSGTLALLGSNGYGAGTDVNGGTLVAGHTNALGTAGTITVNSNGTLAVASGVTFTRAVTFNAGSALGGGGTFVRSSAWTIPASFTVRPGVPGTPGTLTVNITNGGDLILGNNTLEIDFDGTAADKVSLVGGGKLDLGGTADKVVLRGTPAPGTTYVIAEAAGGVVGTFAAKDVDGLGGAGNIVYDASQIRFVATSPGTMIIVR